MGKSDKGKSSQKKKGGKKEPSLILQKLREQKENKDCSGKMSNFAKICLGSPGVRAGFY